MPRISIPNILSKRRRITLCPERISERAALLHLVFGFFQIIIEFDASFAPCSPLAFSVNTRVAITALAIILFRQPVVV